jgi:hypothetical protein
MLRLALLPPTAAFCLCAALHPALAHGQQQPVPERAAADHPGRSHTVFLELLGNAGLYSVNYEHRVAPRIGARIGYARWTATDSWGGDPRKIWTLPLTVSWIPEPGRRGPELGAGFVVGQNHHESADGTQWAEGETRALTAVLGYRWQPGGRTVLRLAFTPFLSLVQGDHTYPDEGFLPSGGFSVGFRF